MMDIASDSQAKMAQKMRAVLHEDSVHFRVQRIPRAGVLFRYTSDKRI
jgi:hypothetical protein